MRGTITICIVLILAGLAPAAAGFHLSAGVEDGVGVTPEEGTVDRPVTVPLDRQKVGLGLTGCQDFEATGSPGNVVASTDTSRDEFCELLKYNDLEETSELVQPKPSDWTSDTLDQHMPGFSIPDVGSVQITQFDVVQANEAGAAYFAPGFTTCFVPGTGPAYKTAHDVGAQAGLTEDGDTVAEKEPSAAQNPCDVYVGAQITYPNAVDLVQRESGAMDMNGWMIPQGKTKWRAFVQANIAGQQHTVDRTVLQAMVNGEDFDGDGELEIDFDDDGIADPGAAGADGGLPAGASPSVCGFFPAEGDKGSLGKLCDVEFVWIEPGAAPGSNDPPVSSEDYSDRCEAPAYLCGVNQPGWYARFTSDAIVTAASAQFTATEHSTTGYDVFHWVLAPTESACQGEAEPGFRFSVPSGSAASAPYAAHDLDVYTTPSTAADQRWIGNTWEATQALESNLTGDPLGIVSQAAGSAAEPAVGATYAVSKDNVYEPNAPGDTSQIGLEGPGGGLQVVDSDGDITRTKLDRSLETPEPCDILRNTDEDVADPWVPYIDARATRDVVGDGLLGAGPLAFDTVGRENASALDPYANTDPSQDDQNRPGPEQMFFFGEVGMLTDKNDNGAMGFPGAENLFDSIQAYPLFWDMWVEVQPDGTLSVGEDDPSTPDSDESLAGCTYTDDQPRRLPSHMQAGGYGPRTGLIQAWYLREPTYVFNFVTSEVFVSPGDRVIVTSSAAYLEMIKDKDTTPIHRAFVGGLINQTLAKLPAEANYGTGQFIWGGENGTVAGMDDQVEFMSVEHMPETPLDYSANCDFPGFGWQNLYSFHHHCEPTGTVCGDDTVVSHYILDKQTGSSVLGEGDTWMEPFNPIGDEGDSFEFGDDGLYHLWDVDPLDNDPSRNHDELTKACAAGDHSTADRIECPHQVTGLSLSGTSLSWDPVPEAQAASDRGAGEIHYEIDLRDTSDGTLLDTLETTSTSVDLSTSSATGTVDVTVEAVYDFTTTQDGTPISYDRAGPASATVTTTLS